MNTRAEPSDNTPWWLPDVTTEGAGTGVITRRCDLFGMESGGPRHLEGGFIPVSQLGAHAWYCRARADLRVRATCRCGHRGQPVWVCNGHRMMWQKRAVGVCPPCAHPPKERGIQEAMQRIRVGAAARMMRAPDMITAKRINDQALGGLWDLQDKLNELVQRGIVHQCPLTLTEVS
jgi:hypothetical protein